uniref:Abscisic acid insensitive 5 protein n=1 Tax=Morus alba TaxID=3498 RepID=A0A6G8IRP0_MORAL|nr:abscisic acid insensitive 5 protein [Morus alba]
MVVPEPEIDQQQKNNHPFSSLGRQSSIYSLTLDEFQHALCDSGKNFGSMNMDEFLTSIWTAEENQAINSNSQNNNNNNNNQHNSNNGNNYLDGNAGDHNNLSLREVTAAAEKGGVIARQASLTRQGSLTLPPPLCRKTVDEVWSEIHRKGQQEQNQRSENDNIARNSDSTPRQPTFGEMTLEDFLIKAGVVQEQAPVAAPPHPSQPQQFGMYPSNAAGAVPGFVGRPAAMASGAAAGGGGAASAYQAMPQASAAFGGDYAGNGARKGAYPPPPPTTAGAVVCYSGRAVNGGGGYGGVQSLGLAAPVSPVSSDGICASQVDDAGSQFGLDIRALRGRKRIIDGPVEKVVERRQRRMIKNRESAARSRARKQAYTVELEAELNQLREENTHLKQALAELERKQKQQYFEEMKMKVQTKAYKDKEKLRVFRRNLSCPL